jgi:hypothetical protein
MGDCRLKAKRLSGLKRFNRCLKARHAHFYRPIRTSVCMRAAPVPRENRKVTHELLGGLTVKSLNARQPELVVFAVRREQFARKEITHNLTVPAHQSLRHDGVPPRHR